MRFFITRPPKKIPVPYVIYIDFESFLKPSADNHSVNQHIPSGFCYLKVLQFHEKIFEPYVYSGDNVMSKILGIHLHGTTKPLARNWVFKKT